MPWLIYAILEIDQQINFYGCRWMFLEAALSHATSGEVAGKLGIFRKAEG